MSERRQINRRAVLQMMRFVTTLFRLLVAMLSQIAFLALITAMSIVACRTGTGRIWKKRPLAPISEYRRVATLELLRCLCRRFLIRLNATTIKRPRTRRRVIVYDVHSRRRSQRTREPQAMSSHVERRRQEFMRRLVGALLTRLKARRKKQKGKVKKGRKEEEEE